MVLHFEKHKPHSFRSGLGLGAALGFAVGLLFWEIIFFILVGRLYH